MGGSGAFDGLTEGFTEKLLAGAMDGGMDAAAAGGRGGRRSSINRFAEQQNRWGFVPGEEDTLNINMNVPGMRSEHSYKPGVCVLVAPVAVCMLLQWTWLN